MRGKLMENRCKKAIVILMTLALTMAMVPLLPGEWAQAATSVQPAVVSGSFMVPVVQQTSVPEGYTGIYKVTDLDQVRNNLDGKYILMADIDFSSEENAAENPYSTRVGGWLPIGDAVSPFNGLLDGNGHKIIGLYCDDIFSETDTLVGLFGAVGGQGHIKDLCLQNAYVNGDYDRPGQYVGPFAARLLGGTIENSFADGALNINGKMATSGGVVGEAGDGSTITYCYNTKEVMEIRCETRHRTDDRRRTCAFLPNQQASHRIPAGDFHGCGRRNRRGTASGL